MGQQIRRAVDQYAQLRRSPGAMLIRELNELQAVPVERLSADSREKLSEYEGIVSELIAEDPNNGRRLLDLVAFMQSDLTASERRELGDIVINQIRASRSDVRVNQEKAAIMSHITSAGGDIIGAATGKSASIHAKEIKAFSQRLDRSQILTKTYKAAAKKARAAITTDGLTPSRAAGAAKQLDALTTEMEKPAAERDPGKIGRIMSKIKEYAPTAATILTSVAAIKKLLSAEV